MPQHAAPAVATADQARNRAADMDAALAAAQKQAAQLESVLASSSSDKVRPVHSSNCSCVLRVLSSTRQCPLPLLLSRTPKDCDIVSRTVLSDMLDEHPQTDLETRLQGAERELSSLSGDLAAAHKRLRRDGGSSTAEEQLAAARKCEEAALAQARIFALGGLLQASYHELSPRFICRGEPF